ncbi:4-(cytidine 5'-diphospho)-2-C-methyl-D-erythritol kinase [bacterium]|nr:4-(cytidine 5'-diphospho)-2-C-methyl-D-erythritol kinase [bacterium]
MNKIKVRTPAKVNLTLEILNKREDGFHNLQSIMQAVNLYDYLTIEKEPFSGISIELSGNSDKIPYNDSNLVYKAATKFFEKTKITNVKLKIYIEKYIPVAAGLAGGSTNAAGTLYALNKLFNEHLNVEETDELCAQLGSDINFCFYGGCSLCTGRGEKTEKIPCFEQSISLIKPKKLGISTKEAYGSFAALQNKSNPDNTTKLKELLLKNQFDEALLYNSFEKALFPKYKELRHIKSTIKNSLMSGSGSTFFVLKPFINADLNNSDYDIFENLKTIKTGVETVND